MKHVFFTILQFLILNTAIAQVNLVPNPSFEQFNTCPVNSVPNWVDLATGWLNFRASPDYFNSCVPDSSGTLWDVPHNGWGYQQAHSGQGYAGFYTYGNPSGGSENYREWIGTSLISPLIPGTKYFINFYYVRAGNGFYFSSNWATNKTGVLFTTHTNYTIDSDPLPNYSQVYSDSILTDTLTWSKFSASFIADSAYQFITIGNMFDAVHTDTIQVGQTSLGGFYYIDDICISTDSVFCSQINGIDVPDNESFVKIFPMPLDNVLKIVTRNINIHEYLFYDINGRKIAGKRKDFSDNIEVDITVIPSGVYIIELLNEKNIPVLKRKIIIVH